MSALNLFALGWIIVMLININNKPTYYSSIVIVNIFVAADLVVKALEVTS